jgi:alpha-D-ribose 1-methylphosphonate 5-triphosphate synthase subunit PhnH
MLTLEGGFTDAPAQSARAFRAILIALSRPGTIVTLIGATPPAPLSQAAGVAALVLVDPTTPVHLAGAHDCDAVRGWLTFHTGTRFVSAEQAAFAIGAWEALQPVSRFAIGSPEYPDRAATLIVEMPSLSHMGATLRGPGIQNTATLSLPDTATFKANRARFPLGFDTFLTAGAQFAGLPRSTIVGDR